MQSTTAAIGSRLFFVLSTVCVCVCKDRQRKKEKICVAKNERNEISTHAFNNSTAAEAVQDQHC